MHYAPCICSTFILYYLLIRFVFVVVVFCLFAFPPLILYKCGVFDYGYSVLSLFLSFLFPSLFCSPPPPPQPIYVKVYYCFILLSPPPPTPFMLRCTIVLFCYPPSPYPIYVKVYYCFILLCPPTPFMLRCTIVLFCYVPPPHLC